MTQVPDSGTPQLVASRASSREFPASFKCSRSAHFLKLKTISLLELFEQEAKLLHPAKRARFHARPGPGDYGNVTFLQEIQHQIIFKPSRSQNADGIHPLIVKAPPHLYGRAWVFHHLSGANNLQPSDTHRRKGLLDFI
jgi:hypothetical protein